MWCCELRYVLNTQASAAWGLRCGAVWCCELRCSVIIYLLPRHVHHCTCCMASHLQKQPAAQLGAPEDVLDDDDALLHHVVHLGLDQLQQHVDAAAGCARRSVRLWVAGAYVACNVCRGNKRLWTAWIPACIAQTDSIACPTASLPPSHPPLCGRGDGHRAVADGAHRLAHKVDVHLGGVLLELQQHLWGQAAEQHVGHHGPGSMRLLTLLAVHYLPTACGVCWSHQQNGARSHSYTLQLSMRKKRGLKQIDG